MTEQGIALGKRGLKHGPKFAHRETRSLCAEFIGNGGTRRLTPGTTDKLKSELARLANSSDAHVQRFTALMYSRYPELIR